MSEKRERGTSSERVREGERKRGRRRGGNRRTAVIVFGILLLLTGCLGGAAVLTRSHTFGNRQAEEAVSQGVEDGDGEASLFGIGFPAVQGGMSNAEEEALPKDVRLSADVINSVCYLNWNATRCDSYEVQETEGEGGAWKTVRKIAGGGERAYASPRLVPGVRYAFRVVAVAGDGINVSEVVECEAAITPMYCTVWPLMELEAYSDAGKSSVAGKVAALDARCVVSVRDGMFGIDMDGKICYIDSNYCLINLPEYVGILCSYDVTNSYASAFMAHGFEIPGLTGEVIKGFEGVRMKDDSFLVPLLYPTARKLVKAIENARAKGYRLKIYEAFRPHEASVYMYRTASEVLNVELPEARYDGTVPEEPLTVTVIVSNPGVSGLDVSGPGVSGPGVSGLDVGGLDVSGLDVSGLDVSGLDVSGLDVSGLDVSGLDVSGLDVGGLDVSGLNVGGPGMDGMGVSNSDAGVELVERRMTYWEYMNDANHSFNLSAFVSGGVSRHNIGVALDLTLEDLATGEELPMQTPLHDLSWFSARNQNNEHAKELSAIMLSAGYGDLYSEWWHFQDNEIIRTVSLSYAEKGVQANCWMTDGSGWRYRRADGTYAADCTLTVDGKQYAFDADGLVIE